MPRNGDGSEGQVKAAAGDTRPRKEAPLAPTSRVGGTLWDQQRSSELSTTHARLLGPEAAPGLRGHRYVEGQGRVSMPGFSFFIE